MKETQNSGYPPYLSILKKAWLQCFNVFMVFFVTLSLFPAIHASIKPLGDSFISRTYYTPVTCFFVFNFSAMLGNIIPNYICFPGPKYLHIPVLLRLLFIPFFLFCNSKPLDRTWPVFFRSDWIYIPGAFLMGLSSGYFSSLSMMYAPKSVESEHSPTAGMMAAFFLVFGILCGVSFAPVLTTLLTMK